MSVPEERDRHCQLLRFSLEYSLCNPEEYSTTVDELSVVLGHRFGSGFGREDSVVAVPLELRQKEIVKLVGFHFLR